METKICSKCGDIQDLCFFQKDKSKKDGYRPDCKSCRKQYSELNYYRFKERNSNYKKKVRKTNPEKFAEREKIYRINNPDKVKLRRKTYYENNKEKQFKYVKGGFEEGDYQVHLEYLIDTWKNLIDEHFVKIDYTYEGTFEELYNYFVETSIPDFNNEWLDDIFVRQILVTNVCLK